MVETLGPDDFQLVVAIALLLSYIWLFLAQGMLRRGLFCFFQVPAYLGGIDDRILATQIYCGAMSGKVFLPQNVLRPEECS